MIQTKYVEKWIGPKGFSCKVSLNDFKVGGKYKYIIINDKGFEFNSLGIFKEIKYKKVIIATDDFSEELKKSIKILIKNIAFKY